MDNAIATTNGQPSKLDSVLNSLPIVGRKRQQREERERQAILRKEEERKAAAEARSKRIEDCRQKIDGALLEFGCILEARMTATTNGNRFDIRVVSQ